MSGFSSWPLIQPNDVGIASTAHGLLEKEFISHSFRGLYELNGLQVEFAEICSQGLWWLTSVDGWGWRMAAATEMTRASTTAHSRRVAKTNTNLWLTRRTCRFLLLLLVCRRAYLCYDALMLKYDIDIQFASLLQSLFPASFHTTPYGTTVTAATAERPHPSTSSGTVSLVDTTLGLTTKV